MYCLLFSLFDEDCDFDASCIRVDYAPAQWSVDLYLFHGSEVASNEKVSAPKKWRARWDSNPRPPACLAQLQA